MHQSAVILATEHLNDLLREANAERQAALVRGVRRSLWSAFSGRLAGFVRRPFGSTARDTSVTRPAGTHPAAA